MRREAKSDVLLVAFAAVAVCLTIYFGVRYGDAYRIGDSEYRRTEPSDLLRVWLSGMIATVALAILVLRRLSGGSIMDQWRQERELLEEARRWDGSLWS